MENQQSLLMADLDEAPCCICEEIESKSNMDWLTNGLGEQGWCCKECGAQED